MCGITGFLDPRADFAETELRRLTGRMAAAVTHRGPDDGGVWVDETSGVGLGHRRLSIVDLSPLGHQPMASASGRFQLAFNGEIYNHRELRHNLEQQGHTFRGHCDSEVLVEAIDAWGVETAVGRFNGMFAFAVWDTQTRRLTLVRDRLGIKPLYYGWQNGVFLFASELKSLRVHPAFQGEINREAIALLLQLSYIPAPHTIYRGIHKLPAGTLLTFNGRDDRRPMPAAYWSVDVAAAHGLRNPFAGSRTDAADELQRLLQDSIRLRMVADVPVGAFLSGGIDSSAVVALMQQAATQPVRTFSIGFREDQYNEAEYAKAVASHLGTEHVEHYVTPGETLEVIPKLPEIYDEPFADSSQIPTFLVSQVTRQSVTVSLSGDGGDELFGGYERYFHIGRIKKQIGWLPRPLRSVAAQLLQWLSPSRRQSLRRLLQVKDALDFYRRLNTHWNENGAIVIGDHGTQAYSELTCWSTRPEFFEQMMHVDSVTYLPDDILVKVDRASMAVGLEARVPLLDHRVVEFAWSLPLGYKVDGRRGKLPLRDVLRRSVPDRLIERPKVGFGVPIDSWLRGPLREWAEDLLDEHRLTHEGYLRPAPIRAKWAEHVAGTHNWHYWLWDVLMFQAWLHHSTANPA